MMFYEIPILTIELPEGRFQTYPDISLPEMFTWRLRRSPNKTFIRGASPCIPYELWHKHTIGWRRWKITTQGKDSLWYECWNLSYKGKCAADRPSKSTGVDPSTYTSSTMIPSKWEDMLLAESKLSEGICSFSIILVIKTKSNSVKILEDPRLTQALLDSILFASKFKVKMEEIWLSLTPPFTYFPHHIATNSVVISVKQRPSHWYGTPLSNIPSFSYNLPLVNQILVGFFKIKISSEYDR